MGKAELLYTAFLSRLGYEATAGQAALLREAAAFAAGGGDGVLMVNGYAGTGKTTAIAAMVAVLGEFDRPCVLLAPTGRSAKNLALYARHPASTVHKCIYRQRAVNEEGVGLFNLGLNRHRDTLFIVDEVSLIGTAASDGAAAQFGTGDLLADLLAFVRSGPGCGLVLVGDSAQLPPVGLDCSPALSPQYLGTLGGVREVELTEVVRQKRESGILENATRLRRLLVEGRSSSFPRSRLGLVTDGFTDVERLCGADFTETLSDAYARYGEENTIVLCRSNKRANRYNAGIRAMVLYREERLVKGERLMVVKNCYHFSEEVEEMDYIANGDLAELVSIRNFEERYGLHFADATLAFPDYGVDGLKAKVCLDTLEAEAASLTYAQQQQLYRGVWEDYAHIRGRRKRYEAVREDPYYNALQLKYAAAVTCHKSQGGQWACVFIDNPFWQEELAAEDLKWLYTALTRAVEKVYLVNFKEDVFQISQ